MKQLADGWRSFAGLYDREAAIVTSNSSVNTPSSSSSLPPTMLLLKKRLHRSNNVYVSGTDITYAVLKKTSFSSGTAFVAGRNLLKAGKEYLCNIKKAQAIALKYESGKSHDDVVELVLDEMYSLLKGNASVDNTAEVELDQEQQGEDGAAAVADQNNKATTTSSSSSSLSSNRPPEWCFNGFFAFMLYGPLVLKERLDLILLSDPVNKDGNNKQNGRSALRAADAAAKSMEETRLMAYHLIAHNLLNVVGAAKSLNMPEMVQHILGEHMEEIQSMRKYTAERDQQESSCRQEEEKSSTLDDILFAPVVPSGERCGSNKRQRVKTPVVTDPDSILVTSPLSSD